jgi:hypothetical protein
MPQGKTQRNVMPVAMVAAGRGFEFLALYPCTIF